MTPSATPMTVNAEGKPESTTPVEWQAYSALQDRLQTRFNTEQVNEVSRAYVVARDAHEGQLAALANPISPTRLPLPASYLTWALITTASWQP